MSVEKKYLKEHVREIYELINEQSPRHHFEFSDPFWVLITTILSHRTKDEVTDPAARGLYNKYKDSKGLASAEYEDVKKIIAKVGFSNVKAQRVIDVSRIINEKYSGQVPSSIDELISLPGIGRKTANVILADAFEIPAIAVDTHVHRIANRIGLVDAKIPEKTEEQLKEIIPKDLWLGFNPMLVEFGKKICKPIGPLCDLCNINSYCRYYQDVYKKKNEEKNKKKPKKKQTSSNIN